MSKKKSKMVDDFVSLLQERGTTVNKVMANYNKEDLATTAIELVAQLEAIKQRVTALEVAHDINSESIDNITTQLSTANQIILEASKGLFGSRAAKKYVVENDVVGDEDDEDDDPIAAVVPNDNIAMGA